MLTKKNKIVIIILAVAVAIISLACGLIYGCDFISFRKSYKYVGQNDLFRIYICGSVDNEGYYVVKKGDTYKDLLNEAGVFGNYYIQYDENIRVDKNNGDLIVATLIDGKVIYPTNLNEVCENQNALLTLFEDIGFEYEIYLKVLNCLNSYGGKVESKTVLKEVLSSLEYAQIKAFIYVK